MYSYLMLASTSWHIRIGVLYKCARNTLYKCARNTCTSWLRVRRMFIVIVRGEDALRGALLAVAVTMKGRFESIYLC